VVSGPELSDEERPGAEASGQISPPPVPPAEFNSYPAAVSEFSAYPPPPPPPGWYTDVPPVAGGYPEPSGYPPHVGKPPKPEPLPVEPREYQQFYRAPAFRWWKPLAAVTLFFVAWIVMSVPPVMIAIVWEMSHGKPLSMDELNTPAMFAANNVSIALAIPAALLTHWLIYRQRPRWLSSIVGGFRWGLFGRSVAIATVGLLIIFAVEVALAGGVGELTWDANSLFLLLTVVLTTPFQAAGEEYMMRGLVFRSVASWFRNRWLGLVIGIVVNSVIFMLLHGAGDPWLIAYYLLVAVLFSVLVWRTGGLEAAIAIHVVNNLVSEMTLPFQPDVFAHIFDRQAGVAGPETLIQMGIMVLVAAALLWQASRLKLLRANAPAALAQPQASAGLV